MPHTSSIPHRVALALIGLLVGLIVFGIVLGLSKKANGQQPYQPQGYQQQPQAQQAPQAYAIVPYAVPLRVEGVTTTRIDYPTPLRNFLFGRSRTTIHYAMPPAAPPQHQPSPYGAGYSPPRGW